MNKVKVLVDQLQPGMFVCELDRPWLETPFLLQGIDVHGDDDIREIGRYCKYVFIDPERSTIDVTARLQTLKQPAAAEPAPPPSRLRHPRAVEYRDTASAEHEMRNARKVERHVHDFVASLQHEIRSGQVVNQAHLKEAVASMTDSVIRNPDALFLLTKLRKADAESYGRSLSVSVYMLALGRHLGFPREELEVLGMGGLLLDIGKMKLPRELLAKRTPLTGEEHKLVKTHVQLSSEILSKSDWVTPTLMDMVLTHHEREDGSGYPRGLRGLQIGIYGKVAGISDCYEDLVSQQAFAAPLAPHAALQMLMHWKGRLFQGDLVEEFVQCIGAYPVGSLVELTTGEVAIVMATNRIHRLRPSVMLILDPHKQRYAEPRTIDLGVPQQAGGPSVEIARGLEQGAFGIDPADFYL